MSYLQYINWLNFQNYQNLNYQNTVKLFNKNKLRHQDKEHRLHNAS